MAWSDSKWYTLAGLVLFFIAGCFAIFPIYQIHLLMSLLYKSGHACPAAVTGAAWSVTYDFPQYYHESMRITGDFSGYIERACPAYGANAILWAQDQMQGWIEDGPWSTIETYPIYDCGGTQVYTASIGDPFDLSSYNVGSNYTTASLRITNTTGNLIAFVPGLVSDNFQLPFFTLRDTAGAILASISVWEISLPHIPSRVDVVQTTAHEGTQALIIGLIAAHATFQGTRVWDACNVSFWICSFLSILFLIGSMVVLVLAACVSEDDPCRPCKRRKDATEEEKQKLVRGRWYSNTKPNKP